MGIGRRGNRLGGSRTIRTSNAGRVARFLGRFGGRGGRGSRRAGQAEFLRVHGVDPSRADRWTAYGGPYTGVVEVYFDFWGTYVHVRFRNSRRTYTYTQGDISMIIVFTQIGANSGLTRYLTQGRIINQRPTIPLGVQRIPDEVRRGFSGPIIGGGRRTTRRSVQTRRARNRGIRERTPPRSRRRSFGRRRR